MATNVTFKTETNNNMTIYVDNEYKTMIANCFISDYNRWILTGDKERLNNYYEKLKHLNKVKIPTKAEVLESLASELKRVAKEYETIAALLKEK